MFLVFFSWFVSWDLESTKKIIVSISITWFWVSIRPNDITTEISKVMGFHSALQRWKSVIGDMSKWVIFILHGEPCAFPDPPGVPSFWKGVLGWILHSFINTVIKLPNWPSRTFLCVCVWMWKSDVFSRCAVFKTKLAIPLRKYHVHLCDLKISRNTSTHKVNGCGTVDAWELWQLIFNGDSLCEVDSV